MATVQVSDAEWARGVQRQLKTIRFDCPDRQLASYLDMAIRRAEMIETGYRMPKTKGGRNAQVERSR